MDIPKYASTIFLLANLNINLFSLFYIFLSLPNCNLIFIYININTKIKQSVVKDQDNSQKKDNISQNIEAVYLDNKVNNISKKEK